MQVRQGGAGGREQRAEFLVRVLLALVDAFQVADQLGGDPAAGLARGIAGTDPGQQRPGLGRRQVLLGPAGDQPEQQLGAAGRSSGCGLRPATGGGRPGPAAPPAAGHRRPGAAPASGWRPARPSARRWHRSCGPARWRTPGCGRTAWAARPPRPRHRPAAGSRYAGRCPGSPRSPRSAAATASPSASIARYPAASVPYRPPPTTVSSPAMTSIVAERLCGSIPMITLAHPVPPARSADLGEPGGHRYFELNKPLLSLSSPMAAPGPRRPDESHTTSAGSRNESDEPGTWTEPRQAPVLRQVNK